MTITSTSNTGRAFTLTADGFASLVNNDAGLWTDTTYSSSTWTDYSSIGYIALADSAGTAWYLYPDDFGAYHLSETAPSARAITSDTGTSGNITYLTTTQGSETLYIYPDGFGSLTATTTEP